MSARVRAGLPLLLLALAVVVAAVVAGPGGDGPPLDPRSTAPDGTKALVDVLGELGADVDVVGGPGDDHDVALLLTDALGEERRAALEAWVEAGGRLVVGDGLSPLSPPPAGSPAVAGFVGTPIARECDVAGLGLVDEVVPGSTSVVYGEPEQGGAPAEGAQPAARQRCFPRGEGHWLVVTERGDGVVVALGGPEVLTNAQLRTADHGLLAASLLAPAPGARVAFVRPPRPGEGDASLGDLVDPRVRSALWQLLVAFVLLAAWRGRRLGRPLEEPRPVHIPGSELVVAVGNLLQQTRATQQAARLLRAEAHRFTRSRLGLPASTPPERVAEVAAERTGVEVQEARRALAGPLPRDEDGVVALARSAERLRSATRSAAEGTQRGS